MATYFVLADTVEGCILLESFVSDVEILPAEEFLSYLGKLGEGEEMQAELTHEQACNVAAEYGIKGFSLTASGQLWPGGWQALFPSIREAMADYHAREVEYTGNPHLAHSGEYFVQVYEDEEHGRLYGIGESNDDGTITRWEDLPNVGDWWDEDWTITNANIYHENGSYCVAIR